MQEGPNVASWRGEGFWRDGGSDSLLFGILNLHSVFCLVLEYMIQAFILFMAL